MSWGWSKKTRYSPIAVDFGADSLKLLQVVPSDPPQVVAAASMDLPEHARLDPAPRGVFFREALKDLVRDHAFKGRRAICSVPAYQTLVQHLQISRSGDQDNMEEQVHQHLRERLNVEPSRMVVRFFPVGQVVRDGSAKQEVICLAVSREVAMGYIETAQHAKLSVVGMHSEPLAIMQAFSHLYRRASDTSRVVCYIDLGSATTKVIVAHGMEMKFAKTIHYAGEHFTRYVAKIRGVPFSEARLTRLQQAGAAAGNPPSRDGDKTVAAGSGRRSGEPAVRSGVSDLTSPVPDAGVAASAAAEASASVDLGESLDCLLDELLLCVRYHQGTFPNQPIEKLVFLGGESRHAWICQKIARSLRIGAQLGDPMARLVRISPGQDLSGIDMREPQPGWAVPVGLCLSEANL